MNYPRTRNMNADVFAINRILSKNNIWVKENVFWKKIWFSIKIHNIKSKEAKYFFITKWTPDFPKNFQVRINGKIFEPVQEPIIDQTNDIVAFFAIKK